MAIIAVRDEFKDEGNIEIPESPISGQLTSTTERRLMTKIDLHVLPVLCVLYLMAFLDRVNISNAALFGLQSDLNIVKGTKYNTALTIFFVPYIIFEVPSNILLKKLKPHVWLSFCMAMFGFTMVMQGLVQNWGGLMATRFFLGVFETGMFPGCFYLLSCWYKRSEAQKRFSFFFSSTTLAGAFGGLLAYGIGQMGGIRGYSAWRWIFIIEGLLTIVIAVIAFWIIPDFPETVTWLNEEERSFIKAKLENDVGKSTHSRSITLKDTLNVFKDYKIFFAALAYFGLIVPAYGYAYFANSIIRTYGYNAVNTQLWSIPPWAAAFVFSLFVAYCSDKLRHRFTFGIVSICISIAGFAMLLNIRNHPHVQYGALFLVTSGTYSAMPIVICWFAMNLGGHHRKAVATAFQIGFGNIGGIISTYSFFPPNYRTGYIVSISFSCLSAAACISYVISLWHANRQRDRNAALGNAEAMISGQQDEEEENLGDLAPSYRYTY
ncbi:putative MFS transporter [Talaromyces proteolyticus]|uniref:MFS transporter n=1 Tax=Talaromyces proteolyticus TaxID=1131652 RepID=A0AAD4Q478_9EURO|nr:putative MFS transporter [Talaromyces proteolyticus]KAH8702563.1 putative MFS transporter [Talaromyces proteolyticus]